ncbi:MAG: protein BatD [Oceanospirillaceae bacterium]|nr:protein BatD [Oceanospirillaceae bacterium]MCP5350568.1 protein BatD [Oceanospirillaceae bacterium]
MVNKILLALILICSTALSFAAGFNADVDRTRISENESLTLTLRTDEQVGRDPDLTPLEQHWEIANSQRSSQFRMVNGQTSSWTQWTVTLVPKRNGSLQIPSLEYAGQRTKPINIEVEKGNSSNNTADQSVFFETSADVSKTYVQGQIIYSEKLYFSVPLDNHKLSEVEVADAVVQPLGNIKQFQTRINGRVFNVFQRQFAIFPQTSGDLIIPGPRYYGEITQGLWQPGRPVRVSHAPTTIKVLPKPAEYPNANWLPASNVVIDAQFSGDLNNMHTGEPITLNITLKANGQTASALPEIKLPEIADLKYYPDQGASQDINDDSGITGQRSQSIAILASKAGRYTLPEIKIPWWNVNTGRVEYATIAAQNLKVGKASNAAALTLGPQDNEATNETEEESANMPAAAGAQNDAFPWQIATVIFALLWLSTLAVIWLRPRREIPAPKTQSVEKPSTLEPMKLLKNACRENNPAAARSALLNWGKQQFGDSITGLKQLADKTGGQLALAIQELDYTLFAPQHNSAWQGEQLWQLVHNFKHEKTSHKQQIADLYPV